MTSDAIRIQPKSPIHAAVTPPGSKSITNRALPLAALADGESVLRGALESEDTQVMMDSLRRMGVAVEHDPQNAVIWVRGTGGKLPGGAGPCELFCGNSGTTLRFLTAMVSVFDGEFLLDGVPRMRERPIGDMLRAMTQLGVDVAAVSGNDCPPVWIRAAGLNGGIAQVAGNISSQFLSGLLMAAPYARTPTLLRVMGTLVSRPYVDMTLAVMADFGVDADSVELGHGHAHGACGCGCGGGADAENAGLALHEAEHPATLEFLVPARQRYVGREYMIEPDASAASYFFAAAAVAGGEITVRNLTKNSLQGDVEFCACLAKMGCEVEYLPDAIRLRRDLKKPLSGVDVDMHHISDTAQTLGVVALFADSPTIIRNVANMRVKETDRIHALVTELRKFGVRVEEHPDGLKVWPLAESPGGDDPPVEVETYHDHRMAMSFAVAGLRRPNVIIRNPACTAKTYPRFFEDLESLR